MTLPKREQAPPTMPLGPNQIGAYAADLLDLEEQIEALQTGKRDLYKSIREDHGKSDAAALKVAVKLARMGDEERDARDNIDAEALRMLAIIEASPAPRATRSASGVPVPEIPSIEGVSPATEAATDANTGGPDDIVSPELIGTNIESFKTTVGAIPDDSLRADAIALGSDVESVAPSNVTQLRPEKRITFNDKPHVDCLDPGQCGGFSNLGLCPRCKAVAGGGAAEIEHHGSIGA